MRVLSLPVLMNMNMFMFMMVSIIMTVLVAFDPDRTFSTSAFCAHD
ncbi:hypothetical protein [Thiomonas sp. FB-Cd]